MKEAKGGDLWIAGELARGHVECRRGKAKRVKAQEEPEGALEDAPRHDAQMQRWRISILVISQ